MKKIKTLLSASLFCLLFAGCTAKPATPTPPICGGSTDYTDANAPKEIISKSIVRFSTEFFIYDRYDDSKTGRYAIAIENNESGEHVLTVKGIYNHVLTVDDTVLADVQEIIDRYDLVKANGAGKVTSGLPAEYGPQRLHVVYDSGEKLYFYTDGSPYAEWAAAFRDYFVEQMAQAGYQDVLPPKEAMTIKQFTFNFNIGADYHTYGICRVGEELYLLHSVFDMDAQQSKCEEFAVITDALYEQLQEVMVANGMDALHKPESVTFNLKGSAEGFLEIYVDYVSGRQIYGEYDAAALPEAWPEMRAALVEFLDSYLRENPVDTAVRG